MAEFGFGTELIPHFYRMIPEILDVCGYICFLVAEALLPAMFMRVAHALAVRIAMVGPHVKAVDATHTLLND